MSLEGLPEEPRTRSGAMYAGEPTSAPVPVRVESPSVAAIPKSVSRTCPSRPSSTLPGLISRCSTPAECAAASASTRVRPIAATCAGGSGPCARMTSPRLSAFTSSMTIQWRSASSATS